MGLFKRKFKYIVYALVNKSNPKKFLTIADTEQQCYEFLSNYLQINNLNEFSIWCTNHNLNIDDKESWSQFSQGVYIKEQLKDYEIKTLSYKKEEITAIIRMFCQCVPIGCSYDLNPEYEYLTEKLTAISQSTTNWKELLDTMKKDLDEEDDSNINDFDKTNYVQ